jgi:hypothetical protein
MRRLIAGSHRKGEKVTTYTMLRYSVLEGVGSDITTLPDFVRAKFTRFENWESTSSAGWDFKLFIPTCNECIVHDKQNPTDEDFLYKVIVYLTTDKVFIQGKEGPGKKERK